MLLISSKNRKHFSLSQWQEDRAEPRNQAGLGSCLWPIWTPGVQSVKASWFSPWQDVGFARWNSSEPLPHLGLFNDVSGLLYPGSLPQLDLNKSTSLAHLLLCKSFPTITLSGPLVFQICLNRWPELDRLNSWWSTQSLLNYLVIFLDQLVPLTEWQSFLPTTAFRAGGDCTLDPKDSSQWGMTPLRDFSFEDTTTGTLGGSFHWESTSLSHLICQSP